MSSAHDPSRTPESRPPEYSDAIDAQVLKIAGVVVLGAIMSILDITVVNVALPTFQEVFARDGQPVAYSAVAWTVTGYTVALATVIPLTGWAADRFGSKRLYLIAITLFTLGSVLCAMAGSIEQLVLFRVIQGLGGGMLMPLGMMIMARAAGPKRMGRLMAIMGIPMLLGPIGGPILGGYLIEHASWEWVFLINLPIGIAAIAYALWALPKDRTQPSETLDVVGLALMSPGLALFLYGVSSIPEEGTFFSVKVGVFATVGLLLMIAFVFWTFRPAHPLLDFRLFRNRNLTVATAVLFLFGLAFFGGLLLIPTYFQEVRGRGVTSAGLLMAAQGLGAMVTMPIGGALADKYPVGRIAPFGIAAIILGFLGLTQIDHTTPLLMVEAILFVMGMGMGFTMMPVTTSALKTLSGHAVARGTTMINIIQQVASSIGVALMSVLLTNGFKESRLFVQAGEFRAAMEGVNSPAAAQEVMARFPEIAAIIGPHAGDEDAMRAALRTALAPEIAPAFANTYVVGAALLGLTLVAALFLPRRHEESHLLDDEAGELGETDESDAVQLPVH